MNAAAELQEQARKEHFLDRPAFRVDGLTWTHGDVHRLARGAATGLLARGVQAGDRIALLANDGIGLIATFLGAARIGAVTVLANPGLSTVDDQYLVHDCAARLIVSDRRVAELGLPVVHPDELLATSPAAHAAPAEVPDDAPLYVQYTSGTTGAPKGAVHRHRDLTAYHRLVGEPVLGIQPGDVLLSVSKLYFAYGFGNALAFPLTAGCSAVLFEHRPRPAEVLAVVASHKVTVLFSVPSFYAQLPGAVPDLTGTGLRSLRGAVTAGETVSRELLDRTSELLGAPVFNQIGSTEAGHAFCSNGVFGNTPGTLGRPIPEFELQVRGKDGKILAGQEVGELWVRGPTVMTGYLGAPDATARVLVDGWLNTRDRVGRLPDGTLEYHGRTDDIEVVGGINVYPPEIERILGQHPAVREVAVVAITDDTGRSSLHAFVVLEARMSQDHLEAELRGIARAQLAPFKVPRHVRVIDELPRTPTGKLQRFKLRKAVGQ